MGNAGIPSLARHRTIFEDPLRFACLMSVATVALVPQVPPFLTFLAILVTQLAPVAMLAGLPGAGWSLRWGHAVRDTVTASNLSLDVTRLAACTGAGAVLLVRHFNTGADVVIPLALLAVGLCLLPDVRPCRWFLPRDPVRASRLLRTGYFHRDPVMLATMLAAASICMLDRVSLLFLMLSLFLLQFNMILLLVDKYVSEIDQRSWRGGAAVFMGREARRLWFVLATIALVPLRHSAGDRAALWGAATIGAAIILPDVCRMVAAGIRALIDSTRVTPATYVMLPKR